MSDEGEITKLQEEYALRFDARDADGFAALFVEDAEVVLPGGFRLLGNEKLHKAVRNMPPGGRHFPEPGKIELDGDTATSSSRFSQKAVAAALPARTASAMAPTVSSMGTFGSTRCWYSRSM